MIDVMEAPEGVRREAVPNSVCVQFYGPSASKGRDRDYCWATAEQLAPFGENLALLEQQKIPKRLRPIAYREALVEAKELYAELGNNVSAVVAFDPEEGVAELDGERGPSLNQLTQFRVVPHDRRQVARQVVRPTSRKSFGSRGVMTRCQRFAKPS